MIRTYRENDLTAVMQIWLDTNMKAHNFIPKEHWTENYAIVKELLPQAEVYVYEDDDIYQIVGFIGFTNFINRKRKESCRDMITEFIKKVRWKRKLKEMDLWWSFFGLSSWSIFPPLFYYTYMGRNV